LKIIQVILYCFICYFLLILILKNEMGASHLLYVYKQSSWCFLYLLFSQFLRHFLFIFKDHRSCHGPTKLIVSHWVSSEATNEETLGNCMVKYWERINADCRAAAAGKMDFALASMQQPGLKSNLEAKIKT
jgi:hypothetical protein